MDQLHTYKLCKWINVRKNADIEMKDAEKTVDITKETAEQPLTSLSLSVPYDYVGTKLDDALLKALERHTADLVEKYSGMPTLESSKKKESKKSPEDIIRIKMEQGEKKQEPTYTIKSTDKAALEEFDLKSALFKSMHKNKSANINPANYELYHALMEALIEDEIAIDKEVADTVKDHKRKHDGDDDDDDDDEGPPAGSNQGKSTKKRRTRESESAKKPSTTKETSKGKDPKVGSKTGKSAPAKDPVEEPTDKVIMDEQPTEDILISDEGHVSDPEDTDNAHMPKVPDTTTWFRPIPEEERPASPEPEWVIPPIDLPEADNNWANAFAKAHQDPDENKLHNKIDDIGSFIRWYCRRIGKEELSKADLEGPAFMMIDLVNPEGHRIVPDISKSLPLGGPPGQVTIQPQFFFNKDLEYLLTGDKERNRALSISKLKAALYQDFGLEELVPSLWIESEREYDISAAYGITHWWFSRKQFYINKHSEPSDRDAVRSHMRILSVISIKTYERYGYNYLREIVLRRADYNEYKISEKDFKSLHPNDFEDLNILHIQGKLDHLPKQDKVNLHNAVSLWTRNIVIRKRVEDLQLGIESYQTKLNLKQPNWDASDFPFKEDYTVVFKPRAVIYRDRDDNRKMMRINEFNKGIENRKWIKDDKRKSEDFIEDNLKMEMEMEIPSVKASANSDIVYFFTSAQDGDPLQDDVRLCLADDLKKAQDHNQRQVNDESKDHYPKYMCDDFAKIMHDELEMSMMGELNFFLGLQIKQMEDDIFFNQSKYIKEMLKKFGLEDSKPMKTPMSSDAKITKDEKCESVDSTKYRGMICSLSYLTTSRLDIMFSVCLCAHFQEDLKTSYLEAVKRIFRYIKGTTHLGLWYPKGTSIETVVYVDSDHAGDYKQTTLAISTTKAKYVSARKACQQALWMKQALIDYDIRLDDVPIMCDNKGAIDLSKNPVQHSRTKHVEIRHHFLRDNVQKGHISIEKVSSVDNIANILTKPYKRESFNYLRLGLGMMEHIP
ncbi:retrovirus-related pol polyprotein from transposon TNT 1-94 [Tanacetum coccineum]